MQEQPHKENDGEMVSSQITSQDEEAPREHKPLTPAAKRALEEAAQRRADLDRRTKELAQSKEYAGRGGLDPVRYHDWEIKGLASDF